MAAKGGVPIWRSTGRQGTSSLVAAVLLGSGEVGQRGLDVSLWQGVGELYQMARVPYLLAGLFLGVGACVSL